MYKNKHKAANNSGQEARTLAGLIKGLSLEGLQMEVHKVKKLVEFSTPKFKDYLATKNTDIDYVIDKGRSILQWSETKQQLVFSKKLDDVAQSTIKDANNWLYKVAKFTPKEILILLYFEMT